MPRLSPGLFFRGFCVRRGRVQLLRRTGERTNQKLTDNIDTLLVYAYGGALAPDGIFSAGWSLRSQLLNQARHSVAARASATSACAGHAVHCRLQMDQRTSCFATRHLRRIHDHIAPYLSMQIHQPLRRLLCRAYADPGGRRETCWRRDMSPSRQPREGSSRAFLPIFPGRTELSVLRALVGILLESERELPQSGSVVLRQTSPWRSSAIDKA